MFHSGTRTQVADGSILTNNNNISMASAIQGDFNHAREQALAHLLLAM
jgi:hypothetical protein